MQNGIAQIVRKLSLEFKSLFNFSVLAEGTILSKIGRKDVEAFIVNNYNKIYSIFDRSKLESCLKKEEFLRILRIFREPLELLSNEILTSEEAIFNSILPDFKKLQI